jgi:predicted nucleic acid-binding protein
VRYGHILITSAINLAEVFPGMRHEEEEQTEAMLHLLPCYEITAATGRLAGTPKKRCAREGKTLRLTDSAVAHTIEKACVLMPDNRKDFPMEELQWYSLPAKPPA